MQTYLRSKTMAKVGDIGWFWCYHLGKAWKVLDRIQNIDPKDTHPYHTYQDSYYEHFQPATDEELAELGLCRKEIVDGLSGVIESQKQTADALFKKLDDAKRTLTSALQWLACPDDISELTGKCNEQNAFDEIRECLDRIK